MNNRRERGRKHNSHGKVSNVNTNKQAHWKKAIKFSKIRLRVNIRLATASAGVLSLGLVAHYAHSKHVSWLFWVVLPSPPPPPLL